MPDIFDEVSEELRADQARTALQRYGRYIVAAMVLTLMAVGIAEWWNERQEAARAAVATQFLAAQKDAGLKQVPKDLPQHFAPIAQTGPAGYRVLAKLQLAAADWDAGRHDQAISEWQQVSDDTTAPQLLRDLATLTSVQRQLDTGDAQALKTKLAPLVAGGGRWRPLAEQATAMLDLRLGRTKQAREIMKKLADDTQAPQGVRQLATDILLTLGDDGAGPHG